jgi:hypothetical protein
VEIMLLVKRRARSAVSLQCGAVRARGHCSDRLSRGWRASPGLLFRGARPTAWSGQRTDEGAFGPFGWDGVSRKASALYCWIAIRILFY